MYLSFVHEYAVQFNTEDFHCVNLYRVFHDLWTLLQEVIS